MSTAPRRPCAAQARIGFQTSIDAVQMWTPSMNSVAGVNRSHKRILMTRDALSLLPSPRLKALNYFCHASWTRCSKRAIQILTKTNCFVNPRSGLESSAFVSQFNIWTSGKLGFEYGINGSTLHLSLAISLPSWKRSLGRRAKSCLYCPYKRR